MNEPESGVYRKRLRLRGYSQHFVSRMKSVSRAKSTVTRSLELPAKKHLTSAEHYPILL
jgi:hypothetical protein